LLVVLFFVDLDNLDYVEVAGLEIARV